MTTELDITKAAHLLLNEAFTKLGFQYVYDYVKKDNFNSILVLEKNKFKKVGVQREAHYVNDGFRNKIWVDILTSEFLGPKNG